MKMKILPCMNTSLTMVHIHIKVHSQTGTAMSLSLNTPKDIIAAKRFSAALLFPNTGSLGKAELIDHHESSLPKFILVIPCRYQESKELQQ